MSVHPGTIPSYYLTDYCIKNNLDCWTRSDDNQVSYKESRVNIFGIGSKHYYVIHRVKNDIFYDVSRNKNGLFFKHRVREVDARRFDKSGVC